MYRFDYNNYNNDRNDYSFKLQRVYQANVENDNDIIQENVINKSEIKKQIYEQDIYNNNLDKDNEA